MDERDSERQLSLSQTVTVTASASDRQESTTRSQPLPLSSSVFKNKLSIDACIQVLATCLTACTHIVRDNFFDRLQVIEIITTKQYKKIGNAIGKPKHSLTR